MITSSWRKLCSRSSAPPPVTQRSIEFLLDLCTKLEYSQLPPLPWYEEVVDPNIQIQVDFIGADLTILSRLLPAMRFRAAINAAM